MDLREITEEVKAVISSYIDRKVDVLHPDWITTDIMSSHSDITGNDADFAVVGCRAFVRNEVRKSLNKIKQGDSDDPQQLVMEGFDHLQKYYAIERGGENCAVRIDSMTNDELETKAAHYEKMAEACYAHSAEIRRYIKSRNNKSKAI